MLIDEITTAKPERPKPIKPRLTIKPSKKTLPTIKPLMPDQAMIAAKKRQVEVAKMALKREKEFQRRKKELAQQSKTYQRKI